MIQIYDRSGILAHRQWSCTTYLMTVHVIGQEGTDEYNIITGASWLSDRIRDICIFTAKLRHSHAVAPFRYTHLPTSPCPTLPIFRTLQIAIVFNLICCCAIINVFKQLVCWPIILTDFWWSCFKFTAACRTYLPRILPVVTSETESLTVQICASQSGFKECRRHG